MEEAGRGKGILVSRALGASGAIWRETGSKLVLGVDQEGRRTFHTYKIYVLSLMHRGKAELSCLSLFCTASGSTVLKAKRPALGWRGLDLHKTQRQGSLLLTAGPSAP